MQKAVFVAAALIFAPLPTLSQEASDLKGASPPTSREVVSAMLGAGRRATN